MLYQKQQRLHEMNSDYIVLQAYHVFCPTVILYYINTHNDPFINPRIQQDISQILCIDC